MATEETQLTQAEKQEIEKALPRQRNRPRRIIARLLILLSGTILLSVVYKLIIEAGLLTLIHDYLLRKLVFCAIELLILFGFWQGVYVFSRKCRHRSSSPRTYYLMTSIVGAIYAAIILLSYAILSANVFSWLFRLCFNLHGLRLSMGAPSLRFVYVLTFTVLTVSLMLLEPTITKRRHIRHRNRRAGKRGPLRKLADTIADSIH